MNLDNVIKQRAEKVIYRDGDKTIKLFNESYSKSNVLNEALNQARVEETGLAMPALHEVTTVDGKWAIVLDYIEGETLEELMEKNPEKEDEYLELFVNLQLEIHSKTAPMLGKLKDKMNRKISEADLDATTQGNASADVARTYLLFCLEGKKELADKYLNLFCKKSDTAKQYVQKWMPIVAASQSVKGNAHEREFLLSWVDVVDYE